MLVRGGVCVTTVVVTVVVTAVVTHFTVTLLCENLTHAALVNRNIRFQALTLWVCPCMI